MNPYIHKVQYYETDMMGVAHHANYIRWMEEARIDFMDQLGFPYTEMEARGVLSQSPVTINILLLSETGFPYMYWWNLSTAW